MTRLRIGAALAALLLTSTFACTTAQPNSESVGTNSTYVQRSTSTTQHRCTTDCGVADEPITLADHTTAIVRCDTPTDEVPANLDQGWLEQECDYRVTGERCWEDALCAVQVIRDTGDFGR